MKFWFKSLLLTAFALTLYFFQINQIPLWSSDEGRYGEIAREMTVLNDYALPHFNFMPYLEKPVLTPLLTAGAYRLLGETPLGARILSIFASLAGLMLVYFFTRRFFSESAAFYAALVLLTTVGFALVGRFAVIDGFMTLLLSAAIFGMMTALFEEDRRAYLFSFAAMGLGFLTKGLIGIVLPGLVWLVAVVVLKRTSEWKRMPWLAGVLGVSLVVTPWVLVMCHRQPDFLKVFIFEHHINRFLTKEFGRIKPFWFYVPILVLTCFPWSLFLPAAFAEGHRRENPERDKTRFLWIWAAVIFIFFSLPKSKLPYYLLPASIPLAMILGEFLSRWVAGNVTARAQKWMQGAWTLLVVFVSAVFAGGFVFLVFFRLPSEQAVALKPVLIASATLLFLGSGAGFLLQQRGKRAASTAVLAGTIYGILMMTIIGMQLISPFQSCAEEARVIQAQLQPTDWVVVLASLDDYSDLPFHLKRRIVVAGSDRGTLKHASQQEEKNPETALWFWSQDEFVRRFNEQTQTIYGLMSEERFREIAPGLKTPVILRAGREKILITNASLQ